MILTLLTDYGLEDEFVGVCHGVARGILPPDVPLVDVSHGVPRHDVRHGALTLRNALPYLPVGVHVAVVDPQVGTERRAVAVRCDDGRVLVGPDNGLLSLAWERSGAVEAIDVSRSQHRLEPVSATFHGRDVFVPVGAALAAGAELLDAGEPLALEELEVLALPEPRTVADVAVAHALLVDGYGNVSLDLRHEHMLALDLTIGARVEVASGGHSAAATVVQTFADVPAGELLVYEDAWGAVALAVNRGDAAALLGVERDAEVRLFRA
jgi:S-adenosylmethionine hydrolase